MGRQQQCWASRLPSRVSLQTVSTAVGQSGCCGGTEGGDNFRVVPAECRSSGWMGQGLSGGKWGLHPHRLGGKLPKPCLVSDGSSPVSERAGKVRACTRRVHLFSSPVAGILSILPALSSSRCKSAEIIFFLSKEEPLLSKAKPLCSRSEIILSNRFVCLFTANEHAEESRVHV